MIGTRGTIFCVHYSQRSTIKRSLIARGNCIDYNTLYPRGSHRDPKEKESVSTGNGRSIKVFRIEASVELGGRQGVVQN